MNFKVLIYFFGFSCLLYFAAGRSEDAPNLNSVNSDAKHPELLDLETKQSPARKEVPSNPTDASPSLQLTTDGRIGELQLSEDSGRSVDVIWRIPNFLTLPYRNDAGIISPDFDSIGFKGYFVLDPKGAVNTSGTMNINILVIPKDVPSRVTHLQVFLKAEDDTLKTYVPIVSFRNYFTCNVSKMDVIGDKESMVTGGLLTVVFKLIQIDDVTDINPEVTPSLASKGNVGDLNAHRISSSKFAMTWVFQDFFNLPEYKQLTGTLPRISPYFFFHIYLTPKGIFSEAGYTRLQLSWRYTGDVPPEKLVPYPKFSCKFSLKTRENTLYNFTQEKYHVALHGGFCHCLVPWSEIYEQKDFLVPGGELALMLNFELESKDVEPETQTAKSSPETVEKEKLRTVHDDTVTDVPSNPTGASSPLQQLTTDGRIGELQLSEDNGRSVDVIWKIPNFIMRPYRKDAGIISPDFDSRGFKGFFVMDPKGTMDTYSEYMMLIEWTMSLNSLIIPKNGPSRKSYLQVFLKAEDGTLKTYVPSVSFRNYFTCNISKMDIVADKESMVPGGVLTVLFKLTLVDDGSDSNPEITPSLASKYDVGDLNARRISSSEFAVTWVFQDFFSLPEYRQLTGTLPQISPDFFFHIYLTPKGIFDETGYTRLQLSWRYAGDVPSEKKIPYPKFSCKFSLKTRENTLYNMTQEKYHVALYGGFCYCLVPWSEIYERKDVLVPRGELSLMLDFHLESKDVGPETQTAGSSPEAEDEELRTFPEVTVTEPTTTSHVENINNRIGELEISRDTQTSVDIIWTINDFFTLPYKPDSGILSSDFSSLGFKGFFVMDPKGSATTPGDLQFRSVIFRHDDRNGKIHFKLFLKMLNGTFTEFPVTVPFDNYFTCDISKLKIVEEKDSLAPGGVLTVLFRLSTTGNFDDSFKRECDCKSEKKESEDCDSKTLIPFLKMSSDFLELYKSGAYADAALVCQDKKFAVHKSILTARSSVFADMFKRDANGNEIDQNILEIEDVVTLTDIDCSILDILLRYIYSARVDNIRSDQKEQLFEAAERYGVE